MSYKFLIDECLSPKLVDAAHAAGHLESTCVWHRGWGGLKDWELIREVVNGDFTLVTNNAVDFRGGGENAPGGYYAAEAIHAGLVCLTSAQPMERARQLELFRIALDEVAARGDLVNHCLEVTEDELGEVRVSLYELPARPGPDDAPAQPREP